MEHLAVKDYGTLANALGLGGAPGVPGPGIASTVTFEVRWRHVLKTQHVRDATVGFEGTFKQTDAHIEWSMRNAAGFRFTTNPSNQTTLTALLGRERKRVLRLRHESGVGNEDIAKFYRIALLLPPRDQPTSW